MKSHSPTRDVSPGALFSRRRIRNRWILLGAIAPVSLVLSQYASAAEKIIPPNFTLNSDIGAPVFGEGLLEGFLNASNDLTTANPKNSSPELSLRMGQSTATGADAWGDNRTWVYTGQVFTGPNGIISVAANNDDNDWLKINNTIVLQDTAWDTAVAGTITGLTPNTWVDFEYRVGNGGGGAGPSGQNINGAANWNNTTGFVMSFVDEAFSLDAAAYDLGRPTEPLGGGATLFRYQTGLGFTDDLRVTASGTVTIDGATNTVYEQSLRFDSAAAATLTVNDGTGVHKTLVFADGTTLLTATAPMTVAGTSDVRLGRISDGSLTGARLIAGGPGQTIVDYVDAVNPSDLNGTTLEAGAGGRLVIRGSNNLNPVASITTPLTISGAGGVINIGSAASGQIYSKAITANESGVLEHTTNTADTIGGTGQNITVAAGKTLTIKNTANTLTIAGNMTGATVANDSTSIVKYTGNTTLDTYSNVNGRAQFKGNVQLTNLNVSGGRVELFNNYTLTNSPNVTGSGTVAFRNASNFGTIPATLTIPSGNVEFIPGAIGTSSLALTGGTVTLAPDISGLTGNYYAVVANNTNNQNADFFTRESYVALFNSLTPTTGNVLTTVGEKEVLSFNPDGSNAAMYAGYGFTAADNIISRMEGKISITTPGLYSFSTRSDDGSVLFLDGAKVVDNNFYQGMTTRSGSVFLSAGLHDIDIGFYEGGGGNGLEVFWTGPGISNQLLPNAVLFPDAAPTTFTNPINVQQNSTINSISSSSIANNVTIQPGKTLTTSGTPIFAGTLNLNGAGTYTINAATGNTFTANDIVSGGAAVNIVKTGPGVFAIDDLTTAVPQLPAGSTITVNEGALGVLLGGATNPLGSATVTYAGGGVVLSSKGGDQSFAIPTFTTGDGSIEARKIASGVAGTTATPININLTGNLKFQSSTQTVTLGTADNYILNVGGTPTGPGNVVINGGRVVDTSGTGLQNLNVAIRANGGTANLDIKSNTVSLGSLGSDGFSNAIVTLGTGTGPVSLTFTGTGSGRFSGNLTTASAGALSIVKNGAGTQSIVQPFASTATSNISAVTVNAGVMEFSPGALGAAPVNLAGGTLQMIQNGLTLRAWDADPGATGAYGSTLNTLAGLQSHYASLGNAAFTTNTANNGNLVISYNPGDPPPFQIHGYSDADTIEALFTGKIFITTAGSYKFSPRSDDGTTVYVDGQPISLNNFPQGIDENAQALRDGSITLSPGYHDIIISFNEGGGGQGIFVDVTGPDGLRRTLANSQLYTTDVTTSNTVNLTASSSIDARGGRLASGNLNWTAGTTLTSPSGTAAFATTTLPGAGVYTVSGAGNVEPGAITVTGGAAVTLNNTGTGSLILNNTATAQLTNPASAINVNGGGRLVVVGDTTVGATNPLGSAIITLGGAGGSGEIVLSNKVAENISFAPNLQIAGSATIAADNAGSGAISGTTAVPLVASLTTPVNYGANALTLRSGSNYNLQVAGNITGTGALNVTGGAVAATGTVNSGAVNVSGGRLTTGALTAASATIGNGAALRLTGTTSIAGGTTVNTGGTLEVNGATYTGGAVALNGGSLDAVGGVTNLSAVAVNGSAITTSANALTAKLYPNFTSGNIGGFGNEQSLINTLSEKPAFTRTLTSTDFNFGPNSAGDGAIADFFGTSATNTGVFTMTFTGKFTAKETGLHSFRESIVDDNANFWVDLNQNGIFEQNGSAGNEKLATQNCCGPNNDPTISVGSSANLVAGQSYRVAIVLEDTGGGGSLAARFSTPSLAEAFINPGAGAQTGFWSTDVGGGSVHIATDADLTLGVVTNINELVYTGTTGTLKFANGAARTTNVGLVRSSTQSGTNVLSLSANDTLNAGLLVVNDGVTFQKTGGGTLVAANQGFGSGSTLEVQAGQVLLNGAGLGNGTVLANGTGTAVINGNIAGLAAADAGGTIAGTGTVGTLEIRTGGVVSPSGATAGALTVGSLTTPGTLTINGGELRLDLSSAASFDSVKVNGLVTLNGNAALNLNLGFNPADNVDQFTIILNDGDATDPIQGGGLLTYNGTPLAQGAPFTVTTGANTQQFRINYTGGDGNDVVIAAIPEPGTVATLLGGMGALVGLQRFRRRTH